MCFIIFGLHYYAFFLPQISTNKHFSPTSGVLQMFCVVNPGEFFPCVIFFVAIWMDANKGVLQVLWERGEINVEKKIEYSSQGKQHQNNEDGNIK